MRDLSTWVVVLLFHLLLFTTASVCALRTQHSRVAFVLPQERKISPSVSFKKIYSVRGGATVSVEEDEEDEEENQAELDAALTASAVKSATKAKTKQASAKTSAVKKAVNSKLSKSESKRKGGGSLLTVPYIVRACMNPFTLVAMLKAYWQSLFNLDFLKEDSSQELRSALEQKAKKGSSGGGSRGKRKMKRGQAKTLSDLPALNT